MDTESIPILSANSMICKPKDRLLDDPNYFLRKHSRSFRWGLAFCRLLYKVQRLVMEKKIGLNGYEQRLIGRR